MNELEIKATWLKIQVNSSYGLNFDYNTKLLVIMWKLKLRLEI